MASKLSSMEEWNGHTHERLGVRKTVSDKIREAFINEIADHGGTNEVGQLALTRVMEAFDDVVPAGIRRVQAKTLNDAADDCYNDELGQGTARWLRRRAEQIADPWPEAIEQPAEPTREQKIVRAQGMCGYLLSEDRICILDIGHKGHEVQT